MEPMEEGELSEETSLEHDLKTIDNLPSSSQCQTYPARPRARFLVRETHRLVFKPGLSLKPGPRMHPTSMNLLVNATYKYTIKRTIC